MKLLDQHELHQMISPSIDTVVIKDFQIVTDRNDNHVIPSRDWRVIFDNCVFDVGAFCGDWSHVTFQNCQMNLCDFGKDKRPFIGRGTIFSKCKMREITFNNVLDFDAEFDTCDLTSSYWLPRLGLAPILSFSNCSFRFARLHGISPENLYGTSAHFIRENNVLSTEGLYRFDAFGLSTGNRTLYASVIPSPVGSFDLIFKTGCFEGYADMLRNNIKIRNNGLNDSTPAEEKARITESAAFYEIAITAIEGMFQYHLKEGLFDQMKNQPRMKVGVSVPYTPITKDNP